ncbi:hypothetical protein RJ641_021430 [Dillenia turbinata]|uniref:Uncharacterized protein n=1 Tax=Dillenia turbinata TaxID=194707 RepID=A0AAN8UHI0_9MAGN
MPCKHCLDTGDDMSDGWIWMMTCRMTPMPVHPLQVQVPKTTAVAASTNVAKAAKEVGVVYSSR